MSNSNEMAEDRTDWAEDRTILANERTFAGWMRTGMACVALAIGLKAVFAPFEPTWIPKTVASAFILTAVFIFWAARRQACATLARLNENTAQAQPVRYITTLSVILSIASLMTGAILWWL
ncbi:YidH family protein [Roseobacter sp. EG26]|uniref:YidH family protein n=1 Tax=Roseobacter sp. EG26 TaxID=3412477 RepID=UPI003CE5A3F8